MNKSLVVVACALLGAAGIAATSSAADPAAADTTAVPAPPITQSELLARLEKKDPELVVLDVRTPAEFAAGHVPGARNVSHDLLSSQVADLAELRDKQVVLYCRSGRRTLLAEETLRRAGFTKLLHLQGDYLAWEAEHRPIEK
ncbi:MAG TPA: rhodanese-like domain-containing protein [Steroidobacteraceae bacterium]|nr:rhodanese-like domain-containing protein [Steroidobacteraceae bacterium]